MNADDDHHQRIKRGFAWSIATHTLSDLVSLEYGRPAHDELATLLHNLRLLHGEEIKRERFVSTLNSTTPDT